MLAGCGEGFAGSQRFALSPGDVVVFPPGVVHGVDNLPAPPGQPGQRLYCLQCMLPNEAFVEYVQSGDWQEGLGRDDMCVLHPMFC